MNKCFVEGHFARDPTLRVSDKGATMCTFTIANNYGSGKNKRTTFFDCVAFEKTAEIVSKYCFKGNKVVVEGRLREDKWTDKSGNNKAKIKIEVVTVTLMDGPKQEELTQVPVPVPVQQQQNTFEEEDLPF